MIVTLTANPSLDRTITVGEPLQPGAVQAALSAREDAGGKGINVARVVHAAGAETLAVLPLDPDDPFAAALRHTGIPVLPVATAAAVRANITITDAAGETTKLNLPGAGLSAGDAGRLVAAVVRAAGGAHWVVLAGSLPPGLPDDFYVTVIRAVRDRWGAAAPRIAVDTSGPALRAVVQGGAPNLIKPNDDELVELTGRALDPALPLPEAVRALARDIVPGKVAAAFVTLGGAGAVLVDGAGAWHGTPPPTRVRSTVGAGDSSLAGFLLAHVAGASAEECVRSGIRYGSAAASLPGTQAPGTADLPAGDVPVRALTP